MNNSTPKILFVSRAYPPVLGGIENQNYGISSALSNLTTTRIIANKQGKERLPMFLPWITLKGFFILRNFDVVLFGDGVLAPLARVWKIIYPKKKYLSIIHGLDITFAHKKSILGKIYRLVNIPSIKKLDKIITVGQETINQAEKIGIKREKCVFIPNGMFIEKFVKPYSRTDLEKLLEMNLANKKVIFRGGRYTKHKGVEWFIRNVMPSLPENYILVAAGGAIAGKTVGDENNYPNCEKAVKELNLSSRVKLFVNIPQPDMEILFNTCDVYVSPNIQVPGSMEGFGITAIEASACGRVVLASNLEGLKDAIHEGKNGFLIEPGSNTAWTDKIKEILEDDAFRGDFGQKAAQFVKENFSWEGISKKYLEEINKVINL